VFWCAGNVRPLEEEERGVIVTLMDVDARHRSEDELRTMRNYLDLVIEKPAGAGVGARCENGPLLSLEPGPASR